MSPNAPPQPRTTNGHLRRVGVEIEFAAIAPDRAAELVSHHFGGVIERISAHRLQVIETHWGKFTIELDAQYAHPDARIVEKNHPYSEDDDWHQLRLNFHNRTRELIGDTVSAVVPTEIVCPPIPWLSLNELDVLFDALRLQGARDTHDSLFYSFGLHLNPEVANTDTANLLAQLRAYMLLAEWLREEIDIDITREVLPHTNPFPKEYACQVLATDYQPDIDTLIGDYLVANPTRNRELDMFPLFAYLRPDYPSALLSDKLVKPRPTFHYRLPNTQLSQPDWSAVTEWNRWVEVERLAADGRRLAERSAAYIEHYRHSPLSRWLGRLSRWMKSP